MHDEIDDLRVGNEHVLDIDRQLDEHRLVDANGDAILDVVAANRASNTASLFVSTGDGKFMPQVSMPTGVQPRALVAGLVDADALPDLLVVNAADKTVTFLKGDGASFGMGAAFAVGTTPNDLAVGDFNGDGNLDVVTANVGASDLSVILGNGQGLFGAPTSVPVGGAPFSVAVGHLNGDASLDLVVSVPAAGQVLVMFGTGFGMFSAGVPYAAGMGPERLVLADLTADGAPDVAVVNRPANQVSVLRGNGKGSFAPAEVFDVGMEPVALAVGDFNGDGAADLVTANSAASTVSVLLSDP